MTQQSSQNLFKSSISDFLRKEVAEHLNNKQAVPEVLEMQVGSSSDLTKLRQSIRTIKPHIPEALYTALSEEFEEISNDQKEAATGRGRYIMEINDWAQPFYPEFRAISEFGDAYIGGHTREMVVLISGKVDSKESYDRLVAYVESKKPPYKLLAKVAIGGGSASPCVSDQPL